MAVLLQPDYLPLITPHLLPGAHALFCLVSLVCLFVPFFRFISLLNIDLKLFVFSIAGLASLVVEYMVTPFYSTGVALNVHPIRAEASADEGPSGLALFG